MPAGYGWSFPADDEVRVGVGSFDPRFHVKEPTVDLAERLDRDAGPLPGQLDPHRLRRAVEGDVFFAGDSAGHCLPLTAEGIRTAFYFGIALGRELRAGDRGRAPRDDGAAPLRARSRPSTSGSSGGCCAPSGWSRGCRRALLTLATRAMATRASRIGRSTTTCRSRHPSFARAGPLAAGSQPEPALPPEFTRSLGGNAFVANAPCEGGST